MLKNQCALVTGASSGIGRAIAEMLISEGAEVFGLSRNPLDLPVGVKAIACDLTNAAAVEKVFRGFEKLDILVNNAGLALLSRISDGAVEDWEKMFQLNVLAVARCCQLALPIFPENGGQIVNISSMSGHRVPATGGFYSASKFALRALTDALRNELRSEGKKTRVATVSPGYVETPLLNQYFEGREDKLREAKKNIRMLQPEDVAVLVRQVLTAPLHVEITDMQLRSADQVG